ncbi:hypothetical protein F0562_020328 [Nyssa sinensis]|uniref:mitogen-activated protein kinase kinase kinase n=1 Tax=Nyssa sinensis TaxID=561372 RepID=A0A5J5BS63_9ASTE|nr:hypothetical protein F0562_020328 [Nyssa sinensis]
MDVARGMMNIRQKPQKPRLDRRNAVRNIDYDASTSSSSWFDDQSAHRTRSVYVFPLGERTSFRIGGTDSEFELDRICRSLGLSGPEDFAIPVAAWEASKLRSSSDHFSSSRFRNNQNSETFVAEGSSKNCSDTFEPKVRYSDELKLENARSHLKNGLNLSNIEARVRVSDLVKDEDVKSAQLNTAQLNIAQNKVNVRCSRDGECGIQGVRPPVLAPPPVRSVLVVDNVSSTWDLFNSFGPQDDDDLGLADREGLVSSLIEDDREIAENKVLDGRIDVKQELNGMRSRDTVFLSESHSDTSNDDDFFSMTMDPLYSISLNGKFRRNITSWQKGDFLGSGSFGTVYEGFTDDGFFFAVKEVSLLDQGTQGKQSIYQLEQEISLLSQFEHENIVQYLGTDKGNGKLYIFLELVTKGSLANLYQKYHLRDTQVSAYTRQILNGLNYLHGRNVVHRDIKCANILVDTTGSVKLADFGLAKATKMNDVKSCKGTAFWMAPEVVNQKKTGYGLAADIWSLGCTVLEMLTRQIPYSHLEGMQALFRIGKGELPSIPNSLSRDSQDFILKCLQVNPDDRPTAAQLLDHPFVKRLSTSSGPPASPHYYGIQFKSH